MCTFHSITLSFRRETVISIRILFADATIFAMDYQLAMLILSNRLSNSNSFLLRRSANGCSAISGALYLPPSICMGGYMLIFTFCHIISFLNKKG